MKIFETSAKRGNVHFRGKEVWQAAACWMLIAQLAGVPHAGAAGDKSVPTPAPVSTANDPVLKAMQDEIKRATAELGKAEQPPYYLGRLCPCVLSSSGTPTRIFTSAKRLCETVSVSRLP